MKKIQAAKNAVITALTFATLTSVNVVFANDASSLFGLILDILSKIFLAIGVFLAIMGVAHYAIANSDGDGPAKRKATMEMASGVAVVVISAAIDHASTELSSFFTST